MPKPTSNRSATGKPPRRRRSAATTTSSSAPRAAGRPRLLTGGNPQIARGEGAGPVLAYIEAMPGWKRAVGRRIDAIIAASVPAEAGLRRAVKWNSPLYGVADRGWFLGLHCCTKYIKIAFFAGAELDPPPPVASKHKRVRYLHVYEGPPTAPEAGLDESQFSRWVRRAASLDGERL